MKGIILAGGTGTRLYPLTASVNKHLLPVGDKPMIFHPIEKLVKMGIRDILIVTGTEHVGSIISTLGSGKNFHCRLTYKVQDEAGGIAQALGLARDFSYGHRVIVLLGDNIFEDDLLPYVIGFFKQEAGAKILLKEVPDPQRYGVATLKNNKIIKITEKPSVPDSNLAVTGIYMYDEKVFSFIDMIKPSDRGELEITDVNNYYIERNELDYEILKGYWTDAGTFESLKKANELVS